MFKSINGARAARVALVLCGLAAFGLSALQLGRDEIKPAMSDNTVTIGCIWRASPITLSVDKTTAGVNCDANGNLVVSGTVSASIALPFAGGSTGNALAAGQAIGVEALNDSTGLMDTAHLDASGNLKVINNAALPAGTNLIGSVTPQAWTDTIVSGSGSGGFGGACSPTPTCNKVIKAAAGTLGSIRWNSTTAMGTLVLTCWNAASIGTTNEDNLIFIATNMSAGGQAPIPVGGDAFGAAGLLCQTNVAIGATQNFTFETR